MELTIGVNSYMDLDEANNIIENELLDSDSEYTMWQSLSDDNKKKLIAKGTRIVDQLPFLGYKYNLNDKNGLHWPRLVNDEKIECPLEIKLGLLKQVLRDYSNSGKQETKLLELGVKSYSIKGASITMGDKQVAKLDIGIYNDIFNDCFRKWVH
jgi:hypothetical protein